MNDPGGKYGPTVAALLAPERLCMLGPGEPNAEARSRLTALTDENLSQGRAVVDRSMAAACRAGLWLRHDYLDESHAISQEIHTPTGSFWHAIMHRREPDYSNAKYWFRQVGRHPVYPLLLEQVRAMNLDEAGVKRLTADSQWDPFAFVDLCQSASGGESPLGMLCRQIQQCEWELLFEDCFSRAFETPQG